MSDTNANHTKQYIHIYATLILGVAFYVLLYQSKNHPLFLHAIPKILIIISATKCLQLCEKQKKLGTPKLTVWCRNIYIILQLTYMVTAISGHGTLIIQNDEAKTQLYATIFVENDTIQCTTVLEKMQLKGYNLDYNGNENYDVTYKDRVLTVTLHPKTNNTSNTTNTEEKSHEL